MGEDPEEGLGYRRDIDGLRAIAILVVVAFHVGLPAFSGGFVGVDVFFVISGFLITALLSREVARRGTLGLAEFYARRVRRLLPALAVVLVGVLGLGGWMLPPLGDQQDLARSALATAAFVSNIHFWRLSSDYFANQAEQMPLLHTWSLAVEEQYYLAWPLLLLGAARLSRHRGQSFRRLAVGILMGVGAASLGACILSTRSSTATAFYLTPFRAWEFAAGGLLALSGFSPRSPMWSKALAAGGLLAIGSATALFGPRTAFPGAAALVPVLGTVGLIASGSGTHVTAVRSLLASRPFVHLGQLSYSWYLWHWPLLALSRAAALGERSLARDGALSLVALLLAELTRRYIEDPIRFARPGPFRATRGTLWGGVALSLVPAAAAGLLRLSADTRGQNLSAALGGDDPGGAVVPISPDCNGTTALEGCTRGEWGRVPGIVVWGDSHAVRLTSLALAFGAEAGIPVLQRTSLACPPLGGVLPTNERDRANKFCGEFNEAVQAQVEEMAHAEQVSAVILAARWANYLDPGPGHGGVPHRLVIGRQVLDHAGSVAALRTGLLQTIATLHELGLRVLLIAPTPEYPWRVPQCVLARGAEGCRIPLSQAEADRRVALEVLRDVSAGRTDVRVFDAFEAFCDGDWCDPAPGGEAALIDEHHLTHRSAAALLPRARADLRWLVGQHD